MESRPDAVLLDVGGVFHLPNQAKVAAALVEIGVELDGALTPELLHRAHYPASAAFDSRPGVVADLLDRQAEPALVYGRYDHGLATGLGVPEERIEAAVIALASVFGGEGGWGTLVPGSIDGLRALAATGVRLGVVSNADGTVERRLRSEGVLHVGPGPGVQVEVVVDSGAVGAAKPDPRIFAFALEALGLEAGAVVHVGDSVAMDVVGAIAAGVKPLHLDPFGDCPGGPEHDHIRSLAELADRLT